MKQSLYVSLLHKNFIFGLIRITLKILCLEIDEETVGTVSDFIFLSSKITADGDGSHEIKGCFLLGRKAMTKLDSI